MSLPSVLSSIDLIKEATSSSKEINLFKFYKKFNGWNLIQ